MRKRSRSGGAFSSELPEAPTTKGPAPQQRRAENGIKIIDAWKGRSLRRRHGLRGGRAFGRHQIGCDDQNSDRGGGGAGPRATQGVRIMNAKQGI